MKYSFLLPLFLLALFTSCTKEETPSELSTEIDWVIDDVAWDRTSLVSVEANSTVEFDVVFTSDSRAPNLDRFITVSADGDPQSRLPDDIASRSGTTEGAVERTRFSVALPLAGSPRLSNAVQLTFTAHTTSRQGQDVTSQLDVMVN